MRTLKSILSPTACLTSRPWPEPRSSRAFRPPRRSSPWVGLARPGATFRRNLVRPPRRCLFMLALLPCAFAFIHKRLFIRSRSFAHRRAAAPLTTTNARMHSAFAGGTRRCSSDLAFNASSLEPHAWLPLTPCLSVACTAAPACLSRRRCSTSISLVSLAARLRARACTASATGSVARVFRGNPGHSPPLLVLFRTLRQSPKHQPREPERLFRGNPVQRKFPKALFSERELTR